MRPCVAMIIREFTDPEGRQWKAWDVQPQEIHPSTRGESYMRGFQHGWLVFETADGREKRRLHPIPGNWPQATDAEVERLLRHAEPVRGDGKGRADGESAP